MATHISKNSITREDLLSFDPNIVRQNSNESYIETEGSGRPITRTSY